MPIELEIDATKILFGAYEGSWCIGKTQVMTQHKRHAFGILREAIDLLTQVKEFGKQNPHTTYIDIVLAILQNHLDCNKFKYDHTNSKHIDVDCNIFLM